MNLIIDVGNTLTKLAIFDKDVLIELFYDKDRSWDSLAQVSNKYRIERIIVATVIDLSLEVREQIQRCAPVLWLDKDTKLPVVNLYKTPETLGYDRIAAVVAAGDIFPGKDILVIDAGTAITYEFIDAAGRYHGGNISPGMRMRFEALHQYTGRLPLVSPEGEMPPIGESTETAIRCGVVKGMEYEITGYITNFRNNHPGLLVFLTGGDDFSFDTNVKSSIFADKFLVLKGLNSILNYNNGKI
jgi:type III pantothenate kinase